MPPNSSLCLVAQSHLDSGTKVKNTHEVEIIRIACHGSGEIKGSGKETMPVREDLVGKSKVLALRYNGCNSVLVKMN